MKTELEVLDGVLVIRNDAEGFKAVLDVTNGEVLHLDYPEASIVRLRMFINKVYSSYAKFVNSKDLFD